MKRKLFFSGALAVAVALVVLVGAHFESVKETRRGHDRIRLDLERMGREIMAQDKARAERERRELWERVNAMEEARHEEALRRLEAAAKAR